MTGDRGSGPIGTLVGVAVFGVLLVTAANVVLHLHAASVVTAVAFDAARAAAGADAGATGASHGARAAAVGSARSVLGPVGAEANFDWSGTDAEVVRLRVDAPGPHLLPDAVLESLGLARVSRAAAVRVERFRP